MQHLGLVANAVSFVGVFYILYRWGVQHKLTFSDHVKDGSTRVFYVPLSLLTIAAFSVFFFSWLLPNTSYTPAFYWLVAAAYALEIATTLVPRRESLIDLHDLFAVGAGMAMGFSLVAVLASGDASGDARALLVTTGLVMTPLGISLFFRNRSNYLVHQLLFHALFVVWITYLTYS